MTEALTSLAAFGSRPDESIDLAEGALLLASLFHPEIALERYRNHIRKLCDETACGHRTLLDAGAEDTPETRLASLKHILSDKHGYREDTENPDHIQNADMIRMIDRGSGGSILLSLLYIHVANAQGWEAHGLDIAGYMVARLDKDRRRIMFTPSGTCKILQAPDLRAIVKNMKGPQAELSAGYYEPLSRRTLLIHLQNPMKLRQIEAHDYEGACLSVKAMRAIDPSEYRLLLDAGVLCSRTGRKKEAIEALEAYIATTPDTRSREEASMLLREIRLMPE